MLNFKIASKHFLTGEELTRDELAGVLSLACELRELRKRGDHFRPLVGKDLAMLFEKPSLRTRMSFAIAMQDLGGSVIESLSSTSKHEEPEDVARVLAGYVHAIMLRTHDHENLERMASKSPIPIINGLSDTHHPCQVLADLATLVQRFSPTQGAAGLRGLKVTYLGDGNNMLHSLLLLVPYLGIHFRYACPKGYEPDSFIVKKARARAEEGGGTITACATPAQAVEGTHAIYTDVWTSMGFEGQDGFDDDVTERAFSGYQVNEELYSLAAPNAVIMHCLPMVRGKEITDAMAEHPNSVLFQQSENRLHAQKALLIGLMAH